MTELILWSPKKKKKKVKDNCCMDMGCGSEVDMWREKIDLSNFKN